MVWTQLLSLLETTFKAVEAGVHAYAARNGQYASLSHAYIKEDSLHFELELPLAIGTVGGLTNLHSVGQVVFRITGESLCQRFNANHHWLG